MPMPQVGQPAPEFQLQTDAGETVRLSDLRGRSVVLFLTPKRTRPIAPWRPADSATI